MPQRDPDHPDHWWYRAEELRAKAHGMRDLDASRSLLDGAEACERQARLLEGRRPKRESFRQKILTQGDGRYYARLIAELEELADQVQQHPELNHHAAQRLREIASDIRQDARLPSSSG